MGTGEPVLHEMLTMIRREHDDGIVGVRTGLQGVQYFSRLRVDECDAARHEATVKIHEWAERRKISASDTITWDTVADAMLEDADELAYLFIGLAQSLPKNATFENGGTVVSLPDEGEELLLEANA